MSFFCDIMVQLRRAGYLSYCCPLAAVLETKRERRRVASALRQPRRTTRDMMRCKRSADAQVIQAVVCMRWTFDIACLDAQSLVGRLPEFS